MTTCEDCGGPLPHGCDECHDGEFYPSYGIAPHRHDMTRTGSIIGSTVMDPKEKWPENFHEDPEAPGCGVYSCPKCGRGKE